MSLTYRWFWSWDHSTNWCHNVPGNQTVGANNGYAKNPEIFVRDYCRVVDYCRAHRIDAVGIAGLLRDRHGGIADARRICGYAREQGVKIYAIAGLLAYGGVYFEGASEYSLENFLAANPECLARRRDGSALVVDIPGQSGTKRVRHACASHPKVEKFVLDSLEWLLKTIPELGGIQMETGDTGICLCERCRSRRKHPVGDDAVMSYEDMGYWYSRAVNAVLNVRPDALAICETYSHFNSRADAAQNSFGLAVTDWAIEEWQQVPEEAFFQWVCDRWFGGEREWLATDRIANTRYRNIMRCHHGTYWVDFRHRLAIDQIRAQCRLSHASGLQGVSTFGEGSPYHPNVDFNYRALEFFADHPEATVEAYIDSVMGPMLGGAELARQYFRLNQLVFEPEKIDRAIPEIIRLLPRDDTMAAQRWMWLASFLGTFAYEHRQKKHLVQDKSGRE